MMVVAGLLLAPLGGLLGALHSLFLDPGGRHPLSGKLLACGRPYSAALSASAAAPVSNCNRARRA